MVVTNETNSNLRQDSTAEWALCGWLVSSEEALSLFLPRVPVSFVLPLKSLGSGEGFCRKVRDMLWVAFQGSGRCHTKY